MSSPFDEARDLIGLVVWPVKHRGKSQREQDQEVCLGHIPLKFKPRKLALAVALFDPGA